MAGDLFDIMGGPRGGGTGTQLKGPGIKFVKGRTGISFTPAEAFQEMGKDVRALGRILGHLTQPFEEIAAFLVPSIKRKFNTGNWSGADDFQPAGVSSITKQVRKAKGVTHRKPLLNSGDLRDSIGVQYTGRKTDEGANKMVNIMTIGTSGVGYAKRQLEGGTWNVPGFRAARANAKFYPDMDRIAGTIMSNSQFYGNRWENISKYPRSTYRMDVPARNFLFFNDAENDKIFNILAKWFKQVGIKGWRDEDVPF